MANLMRERESPEALANRGQVIEIIGKIGDFKRLSEIIAADLSELPDAKIPQRWRQIPVAITLRFGRIEARPGIPALEGSVSTTVAAVCQRCLDPLDLALDVHLKLMLPQTGITPAEYEDYEIWEFDENKVGPADIVEEALIMALPFSALHKTSDDCVPIGEQSPDVENRKTRPFEDLQTLMARAEEKH